MRLVGGHSASCRSCIGYRACDPEAVQTRAVVIAGAREDLQRYDVFSELTYEDARKDASWWFDSTEKVPALSDLVALPLDLAEVVYRIDEELRSRKFYPRRLRPAIACGC